MSDGGILTRFSDFVDLTSEEEAFLHGLHGRISMIPAGQVIWGEEEPIAIFVLHRGWALSSVMADARRHVARVYRPGDIMGASSLPFEATVERLIALTPCHVSAIPFSQIAALLTKAPRLSGVLFLLAQEESATMTDRMLSSSRLNAQRSIAALLLALFKTRPSATSGTVIDLPMTQAHIADMVGLTPVHVNRSLGALETQGLIRRSRHTYDLLDIERLEAFVGMPRRVRRRNAPWLPSASS